MTRGVFLLFVLITLLPYVSAASVSLSDSSGLGQVSVSGADALYAYEVNFDYTGTISDVDFAGFLGGDTSQGYSSRDGIVSVYESILESGNSGIDGSGSLFNVSHTGTLTLRCALFVDSSGTISYAYYNTTMAETSSACSSHANADSDEESSEESASSGGSGGSGSVSSQTSSVPAPSTISLQLEPNDLSVSLIVGAGESRSFEIINTGTTPVTLEIRSTLPVITGLPDTIRLDVGEVRTLYFSVGSVDRGLIAGTIEFVYSGEVVAQLPIVLNLRSENFLFDTRVALGQDSIVHSGESLDVQIDLVEVASSEPVDVTVTYTISDYLGNVYIQESETFFVDGEKSYVKTFQTADLESGVYFVGIEVVYPGAFATSSARFEVAPFSLFNDPRTLFVIIGIAVLLGLVIFFLAIRRPRLPHKARRVH